jgi:soluble lytic murein transglycosylase
MALRRLALALLLAVAAAPGLLPPAPAAAQSRAEAAALAEALRLAARGDWPAAREAAAGAGEIGHDIIEWQRLRAGQGDFATARSFLERRPDWPGLTLLRERAEATIPEGAPHDRVIAFFRDAPPATGAGARALIAAHRAAGDARAAEAEAVRAWRTLPLTAADEAALEAGWPRALAAHHTARLDMLLWAGRAAEAERMLPRVDAGWQRLARARLGLQARANGVDALVAAVPAPQSRDAGLAYDRFVFRMRAERYDAAADLLLERSGSAEALGRPEAWAPRRALLARRELRLGDPRRAYRLASTHHLTAGADFADLEFLAGFIALRRLDDPARALRHFRALRAAVRSPISLSRAAYWEGRAHEALGEREAAQAAYAYAAEHQTAYYGLLAAERAGIPLDPRLAQAGGAGDWRAAPFRRSSLFRAAELLRAAGDWHEARRFALHLAEGLDAQGLAALSGWALDLGESNWAVLIAKQAAARGIILPAAYFPVVDLGASDPAVPPELALAIARRESEFDPAAVSPAGARGLMQVMPATAERMAARLGLPYALARLTSDPVYNARLGIAYLADLRAEFGASPLLVAAAYNAGPGRPRRWIEEIGDPRAPGVDPVDWVEMVPFAETRTYIMRVVESLPVYRARLAGRIQPLRLTDEMKGR